MMAGAKRLFPACAGVILNAKYIVIDDTTIPRVCGGDPGYQGITAQTDAYSPRVRG